MSVSIREIVSGVRDYLNWPDYQRLPQFTVLQRIQDKSDYYRQSFNLTNRGWFLSRFDLPVDASTDEFTITAPAFGRPVMCLTKDDSDPNHIEREVEIVQVQNRDLFYTGTKQSIGSYTLPHVAACISFFNDVDRGWLIKVTPQHTQAATYAVWYQPDRPAGVSLNDNYPLMESFINLLKVDVALSLLGKLAITDSKGIVTNAGQLSLLERGLMRDMYGDPNTPGSGYLALFNKTKEMPVNEQTGGRRGWASESDYEVFW